MLKNPKLFLKNTYNQIVIIKFMAVPTLSISTDKSSYVPLHQPFPLLDLRKFTIEE